jgi:hypothetical protein
MAPMANKRLRRERCGPRQDEWHFLSVGIPLGLCLMVLLPLVFGQFDPPPQTVDAQEVTR